MYLVTFILFTLGCFVIVQSGTIQERHIPDLKIVDWDLVTIEEAPYQVSVQLLTEEEPVHVCGGALISVKHVLTAAQCVFNGTQILSASQMAVYVGSRYLYDNGALINVDLIHAHPGFNPARRISDDIALLKLISDVKLSLSVQIISLKTDLATNDTCLVTGWGITELQVPSHILLGSNSTVVDFEACKISYALLGTTLTNGTCCAMGVNDHFGGPCQGDRGGPLMCNRALAGIFSRGIDCTNAIDLLLPYPSVYTDVKTYIPWIETTKNTAALFYISSFLLALTQLLSCISRQ